MNINTFIPSFERFNSLNMGLKRLLFVFSFLIIYFLVIVSFFSLDFNDISFGIFILVFAVLHWYVYWSFVRMVLWIYDGFVGK